MFFHVLYPKSSISQDVFQKPTAGPNAEVEPNVVGKGEKTPNQAYNRSTALTPLPKSTSVVGHKKHRKSCSNIYLSIIKRQKPKMVMSCNRMKTSQLYECCFLQYIFKGLNAGA
jgi:hypothetical protein